MGIFKKVKKAVKKVASSGLLSVAVQVGINFVPGLNVWGRIALSMVASKVMGSLFSKKPKSANDGSASEAPVQSSDRLVSVRQPAAPWDIVYGECRKGGVITYIETSADKQNLMMVITLAGHVSEAIDTIYFNDEEVPLDGSGNATGTYAGYVFVTKSLGDEAGQPFPNLVSESEGSASPWTDACRQTGRTKIYVRLLKNVNLFANGVPEITVTMRGRKISDPRVSPTTESYSNNAALCLSDYLTNTSFGMSADIGERAYLSLPGVNGNYASTPDSAANSVTGDLEIIARIRMDDSTPASTGMICSKFTGPSGNMSYRLYVGTNGKLIFDGSIDGTTTGSPTAYFSAASTSALGTTDDIYVKVTRVSSTGLITLYSSTDGATWTIIGSSTSIAGSIFNSASTVEIGSNQVGFETFDGRISLVTISDSIGGDPVVRFDPGETTDGATSFVSSTGETWTINTSGATVAEIVIEESEVNVARLIAAADTCSEAVALAGSPSETESRYPVNGMFRLDTTPQSVIGWMLAAMGGGKAIHIGGQWHIHAGAYEAATITLDEDDFAGPIRVQSLISRKENANGVKGVFTDKRNNWQTNDFPAIASDTYKALDGGQRVWRDIDLSTFVTSSTQAQRIAKIELLKMRQGLTVETTFKLSAYEAMTGKTVALTHEQYGWTAKEFDIASSKLAVGDDGVVVVEMSLRETAEAIYDWSTSEEQTIDLAPNTGFPDPYTVDEPGIPSVTEDIYETRGGRGVAAKAIVTWVGSDNFYSERYQFEYKLSADSDYTVYPITADTTIEVLDIAPGDYDFRVKSINSFGVSSSYATLSDHEIVGLGALPSTPTGLSLQIIGHTALLTLDTHPDLDVLRGGRILVRHTEAVTGQSWEDSVSIGAQESWPGDTVMMLLPLKAGTYMVKARDALEQESSSFDYIVTKQASDLTYSTTATITEDPTFGSGSPQTAQHVNTIVSGGGLQLDVLAGSPTSSISRPDGTYYFNDSFDFGSVKNVRVTGLIQASVFVSTDLIDSRLDPIDSWADFDGSGGYGSECDAWIESRETDDTPTGSPTATWTDWKRLDSAVFRCRAMQFRARLIANDGSYNISLTQLRVIAEEVV